MQQQPSIWRRVLIVVAVLAALVLLIYLAVRPLPESLANTDHLTHAEARAEVGRVRTALLASLAGAIAVMGAILSGLTYRLNSRVAAQTHERDLQGQITERFTRAIDQLGSEKLDIRLGGIYALERIARDSAEDQPQVVEVLSAFVREHAPWKAPAGEKEDGQSGEDGEEAPHPNTDIQAALTVLCRRNITRASAESRMNLSNTDLRGANLRGGHFEHAAFGETHLEFADLEGTYLDQAGLFLARLDGAWMVGAQLRRASLYRASFEGANLSDADLTDADFFETDLRRAKLAGVRLSDEQRRNSKFD